MCEICKGRKKNLNMSSTSIQAAAGEEERSGEEEEEEEEEEEKADSDRLTDLEEEEEEEEEKAPSYRLTDLAASNNIRPQPPADEQGAKSPSNNIQRQDPIYFFGERNEVEVETEEDDEEDDDEEEDDEEIYDEEEDVVCVSEPPRPKPPARKCRFCLGLHSPVDNCDGHYCLACDSNEHYDVACPYLKELPQYAKFNPKHFEIRCRCGCPFFDKDKWVCPSKFCGMSRPVIALKTCSFCHSLENDHTSYDCPKKEDAANHKSKMLKYYLED